MCFSRTIKLWTEIELLNGQVQMHTWRPVRKAELGPVGPFPRSAVEIATNPIQLIGAKLRLETVG